MSQTWQAIAKSRLEYGMHFGINTGLKVRAKRAGLELDGTFADHLAITWKIHGHSRPIKRAGKFGREWGAPFSPILMPVVTAGRARKKAYDMTADPVELALEHWLAGEGGEAEDMLLTAADGGNGHAAHNLGTLYASGAPGVERDEAKSRYWYEKALESGFEATVATDPEWFRRPR